MTQQDSWIERFEKEFGRHTLLCVCNQCHIKSFIASEIERAREEGRDEMRLTGQEVNEVSEKLGYDKGMVDGMRCERERIIGVVEKFDVQDGIHGDPVKNPLMRLNDFKSFLLEELKK